MTIIDEGTLRFMFGSRWEIIKLDEAEIYRRGIEIVDGTKSVDFVGLLDQKRLYFIEVKDFRGHRIENQARILTGELITEVAQKVRDSVACLATAPRGSESTIWKRLAYPFQNKTSPIRVVL